LCTGRCAGLELLPAHTNCGMKLWDGPLDSITPLPRSRDGLFSPGQPIRQYGVAPWQVHRWLLGAAVIGRALGLSY
jgi:hypothetical protein